MVDWQDDRIKGSLSTHCHTLITNLAAISDLLYRHGRWLKSHEKNMNQNPYLYLAIYGCSPNWNLPDDSSEKIKN